MMMRVLFYSFIFLVVLAGCSRKKEIIYSANAPSPVGPYSQATRVKGILYVSGQIGVTSAGVIDSTNFENECRQTLSNMKAILLAAGMNMGRVCKTTVYLTNLQNFNTMNKVFAEFFPEFPPARETIEVQKLPRNAHVEISAIAR
jgi:2-iminobutanoate/2-iminopropanoate deaminase